MCMGKYISFVSRLTKVCASRSWIVKRRARIGINPTKHQFCDRVVRVLVDNSEIPSCPFKIPGYSLSEEMQPSEPQPSFKRSHSFGSTLIVEARLFEVLSDSVSARLEDRSC